MADAGPPPTPLTFTREKDTKNTVRYKEDTAEGQAPVIGSLYVQKSWLGAGAAPDRLLITITKG